ncbi:putative disease resistance protein RGA1 [Camellia lanceoleosa]|uniref:Disease resistance protein RGA1 n=1 Tax=Camellia lanceoleosa TaxID=1840588 RepID=A0ACC0HKQ1_9ERIC|nr:putative disease resistance protein RGA1 [Camellia lanceoleosa]
MRDSILKNIVSVVLHSCRNCLELPAFGQLPSLRGLEISKMDYVEYIDNYFPGGGPVRGFPCLKVLIISKLPNLVGLSREEGRELLPCIHRINIHNCPKLTLPHLSSPELLYVSSSSNVVRTSISNLNHLTTLSVHDGDMVSFPEKMLQNLTVLESLEIESCSQLKGLPTNLESLVSLKSLSISRCHEIESLPDHGLRSLKDEINEIERIESSMIQRFCRNCLELPAFGQLPSLRLLEISEMDYVEYIDNYFPGRGPVKGFPSLEVLFIYELPNLVGLSREEGRELLPCFHQINIHNCPKLTLPRLSSPKLLNVLSSSSVVLSSISNLNNLITLSVHGGDMISFPEEMLQNLTVLQSLEIKRFSQLTNLESLVSLKSLRIWRCHKIVSLADHGLRSLKSLKRLTIEHCNNLSSLSESLGHLTALEKLMFMGVPS